MTEKKIELIMGLYCSPSCDQLVTGVIRRKSVFVTYDQKRYRLNLQPILEGKTEIRDSWAFEKASNKTPEQIERMLEVAKNWLD